MKARVFLTWDRSASDDVNSAHVSVTNSENGVVVEHDLRPDVQELNVGVYSELTSLSAKITVTDGTYSTTTIGSFQVPDLTKPAEVENVGWTYEIVEDKVEFVDVN